MTEQAPELLWKSGPPLYDPALGQETPSILPYLMPGDRNGCVIVCPGGGYVMRSDDEGGPIAEMLNANGISAFVLNYRVAPYRYPAPLLDLQRAIRYIRFNASRFGVDPEKIGVLGFSAGGHLACMSLELFDNGIDGDEIDRIHSRPDAGILCYPVVSFQETYTHCGSRANLLGGQDTPSLRRLLSGECSVPEHMPPVFLWHTAADSGVSVDNSLGLALALSEKHIPFELHVFPEGEHGLGLAHGVPGAEEWPALAAGWLHRIGF